MLERFEKVMVSLDRDGDGLIEASDILDHLGSGGDAAAVDEGAVRSLLRQASSSGSGEEGEPRLSLDDFRVLMLGGGEEAQLISSSLNRASRTSARWQRAGRQVAAVASLASSE